MYHSVTVVGFISKGAMLLDLDGSPVAVFTVRTVRRYMLAGHPVKRKVLFRVSVRGDLAVKLRNELIEGARVFLVGEMTPGETGQPKVWKAKREEEYYSAYDMRAFVVRIMGRMKDGAVIDEYEISEDDAELRELLNALRKVEMLMPDEAGG